MYDDYLEEKVDKLEEMVMRLVYIQQKTEMEIQSLKREMKEFKDEMKEFKNEMKEFKDEMKEFKDEMKEFKDEMKEFKNEMKEFKDWSKKNIEDTRKQIREMNKQWGHLSNKLGTIVEDIIFPASRPILKKYFNCDPETLSMNIERKKGDLWGEFDIIALCDERVFLIEVKATPKKEYIDEFLNDKIPRFRKLFPEYENKKLILIFASLRIPEKIVEYLTQHQIYAMAYREWEFMDILNFEQLSYNDKQEN